MIKYLTFKNLFFVGLLVLAFAVKIQVNLLGFSPLDGVWQLSSWCSNQHSPTFFNHYTQNANEHFYIIAQILSPILGVLGSAPIKLLFFGIFVLNSILTWFMLKPVNFRNKILFLIVVCNPYFHQGRLEDLAITTLLSGLLLIRYRPSFQFVVFSVWMILMPLYHPVSGVVGIVFIAYLLWRSDSNWRKYLPIIFGLMVMLTMFAMNVDMYKSQISYRASTNYIQLFLHSLLYLIPLSIFFLFRRINQQDGIFLLFVMMLLIVFGKDYYLGNAIPILLFFYVKQDDYQISATKRLFAIALISFGFLLFPMNKLIQWSENPSSLNQERAVMEALNKYEFSKDHTLFIPPTIAEPYLKQPNTRFVVFDPRLNQLFTHRPFQANDILVLTDEDEVAFIRDHYKGQWKQLYPIIFEQTGPPLLSSGYTKRKNGIGLWMVKF